MSKVFQHDPRAPLMRALRWCSVLVTFTVYTVMAPFGCGLFALLSWLWRRDAAVRARRLQRIQAFAFRLMFVWLRLMRIAVFDRSEPLHGLPGGPCVIIANHPTLMDITAITAVAGSGTTVVKPAIYGRRLLHGLLVGAGHIEGPGKDPVSAGRVVDEAVLRLGWGMPLIVFPEGTRSPRGGLLRFGRLAFEVACRAKVPLVSLTITCEPVYLSKDVPLFRPPHPTARLRLGVLAVDAPDRIGSDSRVLRDRVEERYRAWLRELAPSAGLA
jgi:1-acyl-sn-glycerol-3-phosphate acyltransferase